MDDIETALDYHRAGRLSDAVPIYQQILQADPDNADALHLLGNAACQLGNADAAVMLIARANALLPANVNYLLSLGMAYRAKGMLTEAMAAYEKVLAIVPDSAAAHFGIANTWQSEGNAEMAVAAFATALTLDPGLSEARFNLANLHKSLGNYAAAIAEYRLAVETRPGFADAWHNMGASLYALGDLDEALLAYRQALPRDLPETHNNIGNIHYDRGQFEQALDCYWLAIAGRPDYAEAHNNAGNALNKLNKPVEAAAAFAEAIRLKPDYAIAYLNLGDLLAETGQFEAAARQYANATGAAPDMAEAYFSLGITHERLGDLPAARGSFERAIACRPDYVDAIYNLGAIHGRLLQFADAEHCYRQVLALDPEHIYAHINLSAILIDDGRREEGAGHIDFAYARQNLFTQTAPGADKTVLILFDGGKGNLNLTYLFDKRRNNLIDWMIAYAAPEQMAQLPPYDVVFNAMGDPDLTRDTAGPVRRFLDICDKPLLNHPDTVARTARDKLPDLLAGIDNLLVPAVWRFADNTHWDTTLAQHLPLLIRPIYSHGGVGLTLATTQEELARFRAEQPGPVYVSRYVDYRSSDTFFRKYRMIFIGRKPYPYHLAISPNWIVHYYNAGMATMPWKLAEEQAYLADPEQVLGAAGMRAIEAIGQKMDLDYAGIDFTVLPDGRLLVFEANPTMLAHPEDPDGPLAHKNQPVQRIFDAFEDLLTKSAAKG
jgi:tetratricopeptide (TPR) repeat protein/glutathione synthase/RimK-type ligase-like ATP-grasp enzyme